MEPLEKTLQWYAEQADSYLEKTQNLEMSELYRPFLQQLPSAAHILDLGCGSGRDSRAFLQAGYRVTALDASPALADRAAQQIGQAVRRERMEQLEDGSIYHGIWACASLLSQRKSSRKWLSPWGEMPRLTLFDQGIGRKDGQGP